MNNLTILVDAAAVIVGCASTAPMELVNARAAFQQASAGPAATVAPAELHVASLALALAEQTFKDHPGTYNVEDLAYVAQRKAELAEATASIEIQRRSQSAAKDEYQETQGKIVTKTKEDLSETRSALADSERTEEATADKLSVERKARIAADKRAADALAALAKLGAVKEEPRGTVITLSGSVLFASNQSVLLPEAMERLNQVTAVLLTTKERNITVEGHTDSKGAASFNIELSQNRANTVRNYIVQRGYEGDLVKANGLGEGHPIADNTSPEGRANNRRVEIIIESDRQTSTY